MPPLDLLEALRTTGAVRQFTTDPVDDHTVAAVLDDARFAPSGGNRQPWRVAVVRDAAIRTQIAALMQTVWNEYVAADGTPFAGGAAVAHDAPHTPNPLLDNILGVPVVLAVAADLGKIALMDGHLQRPALTSGASVYPFCWSVLLAARARGLGGVITTFLSRAEPEAAPLLGVPANHALAATIFLGVPAHQPTRLSRTPVGSFATVDRFDGAPFS
jgi:nitroreductase